MGKIFLGLEKLVTYYLLKVTKNEKEEEEEEERAEEYSKGCTRQRRKGRRRRLGRTAPLRLGDSRSVFHTSSCNSQIP